MDTNSSEFYINGAKRMVAEGKEVASKIIAYMKQNEDKLNKMDGKTRKKFILTFDPAKSFNEVHPIVFHYLAVEGVFHPNAFKRYIFAIYGKPKDQSRIEAARHNKKDMYHYKNEQFALYYKYLLIESNPNIDKNKIHQLYINAVKVLNKDTDRMLDLYEEAEEKSKISDAQFSKEKRQELIDLLKKKL